MQGLSKLKSKVSESKSIMIVTADKPNFDCIASSLSLYLALKNAGKNVVIASNSDPIVRDSHLVGLDKIKTDIGNTNLVITFDHQEDSIEKVSYNVEDGKFNLVIQPKSGYTMPEKENLTFSHTGANADLVIVIGASSIAGSGEILSREEELLKSASIANISNRPGTFGTMNIVDPNSSLSELVTAVIQELKLKLNQDSANNLMRGIEDATDNLASPNMTADTFEALAILYRAGARRGNSTRRTSVPAPKPRQPISRSAKPVSRSQVKPTTSKKPSPDWLSPKIYKGSSKI